MSYVNIVLTTDKRLYIAPPWSVKRGDVIGVPTQCGGTVLKTVEDAMTKEYGGEVMLFLERMVGCGLKKVEYTTHKTEWAEDVEDVHE